MAIRFASFYLTFSAQEFLKLALQGCVISLSLTTDHSIYEVFKQIWSSDSFHLLNIFKKDRSKENLQSRQSHSKH